MNIEQLIHEPEPSPPPPPPPEFRPRNTLEGLPAELLTQILEHLVPEPPELGETRPVNYEKLHPEEPWYERTRRRRGLRGCCLSSATLCAVARPLLYRNVFIIYEEHLTLLLRTLLEKPALGTWARFASVHLTLTDDGICREIWRMAIPAFAALHSISMQPSLLMTPPSYLGRKVPSEILMRMPQELLYLALRAMTRLECLLLQIPITLDQESPQYDYLCENFAEPPPDSMVPPRPPACDKITQLLLQADPDYLGQLEDDARHHGDDDLGIEGGAIGLYWPIIASCPSLDTIEIYLDDGRWFGKEPWTPDEPHEAFDRLPALLPNVTRLFLNDTFVTPQQVARLLTYFPALERLYVDPRWSHDNNAFIEEDTFTTTLDDALRRYGRRLRQLDLGFFDCRECEETIGDDGRLTCLPEMTQLVALCVQLNLLCPSTGTTAGGGGVTLSDLFPPSLEELSVEDWWWSDADEWIWQADSMSLQESGGGGSVGGGGGGLSEPYARRAGYRAGIVAALMSLASLAPEKFPQLRKVAYLVRSRLTWRIGSQRMLEPHMAGVREAFQTNGIEFTVAEN